jgi:hypothetical protein
METKSSDKTTRIRELNDQLRTTFFQRHGRVLITVGVDALPVPLKALVDFGAIEIEGERYFWKIDYYNPSLQGGSEDPADPQKTTRVLTIMCAEEY